MKKPTLMIVDDEIDIRRSIGEYLSDEYNYIEAESGVAALEALRHHDVDVIITDFNMPDLDGLELIRSLNEISAAIPVIVMTGRGSQELHVKTLAYNVFEYIEKPFQFKDLRSSVRKCLLYYKDHALEAEETNIFSKSSYEDIHLKLPKKSAELLRLHCREQGLSMGGFVDKLVNEIVISKKKAS